MKAISAPRGGTILCSHTHHFTLCNRLCFLSLHPSCPPRPPSLHLTRSSLFLTHSTPVSPKTHRFVLRAAESTQPASISSADKTIATDDEFSLAKVPARLVLKWMSLQSNFTFTVKLIRACDWLFAGFIWNNWPRCWGYSLVVSDLYIIFEKYQFFIFIFTTFSNSTNTESFSAILYEGGLLWIYVLVCLQSIGMGLGLTLISSQDLSGQH